MSYISTYPYDTDQFIIKRYGEHLVRICYLKAVRQSGWELLEEVEKEKREVVNTEKLDNNLIRAKSTVREYALCNDFEYWCTFTIDQSKFDRFDLKTYYKGFSKFLNNYNRLLSDDEKVKYLFIPEKHKNGAWHMHGFISGIRKEDLYTNEHGYLTWKQYEKKFGFISMSPIRDIEKTASYAMKYMCKDLDKNVVDRNCHVYYCSQGLKKATNIYRGHAVMLDKWDFEDLDGFYKVKTIDLRYQNLFDYVGGLDDDITNCII